MDRFRALAMCLLLSACATARPAPADFAARLPGTWTMTTEIDGTRIAATTTYDADGQVEERVSVRQGTESSDILARGRWTLEGHTIVTTYTESNAPGVVAVGSTGRDTITFLDAKQLSIVDEDGTAATLYRADGTP